MDAGSFLLHITLTLLKVLRRLLGSKLIFGPKLKAGGVVRGLQ